MTDWQPTGLYNELVRLEPMQPTDFERLFQVASDPLIWEQHPEPDRYRRDVFQKFFTNGLGSAYLILDQRTDELIGSTRYYNYDPADAAVAIGFTFLARKYWGGTYNLALKKLMLDYAFRFVEKVYFHIGPNNTRSIRANSKLGLRYDKVVEFELYGTTAAHSQYVLFKEDYLQMFGSLTEN